MPLYTLLVLYTVIGRNMPAFGGVNAQSMSELNAYFSILTQSSIITLLIVGASWVQLASNVNGLSLLETVLSRVYLENVPL